MGCATSVEKEGVHSTPQPEIIKPRYKGKKYNPRKRKNKVNIKKVGKRVFRAFPSGEVLLGTGRR